MSSHFSMCNCCSFRVARFFGCSGSAIYCFHLQRFASGPITPNTALSSPPQANELTTRMKACHTDATADTVSMVTRRLIVDTPASPPHQPADVSSDL